MAYTPGQPFRTAFPPSHLVVQPFEKLVQLADLKLNLALQLSIIHLQMPDNWLYNDVLLIEIIGYGSEV